MGSVDKNSTKNSIQFDDLNFEYSGSSEENDINISQKKGAIDEAMKMVDLGNRFGKVEKKLTELTKDDIWGIEHDSVEQCVQFYKHYAKAHDFVARCDEKGYDFNGNLNMRQMQKGGPEKIGFTKKDLYNYFDKSKHAKVKDSDAYATLSYLISKADEDPLLQGKFTLKDNKLENLVWANGASIVDYQYFSDVLAFDTTYQKNKYNKPLVVFSGTNHHGQTCIFGCGLLADEKHETYVLVLKIFLEITGNKHPTAVVTDGDLAMRGAIREVMPNATHRLCAWHLHRNACEAIKNSEFLHGLKHLMYGNFFPDEFEDKWLRLVLKFKLFENEWVKKTYKIKRMWAFVYLNDKLFGRNRTTSQCEGIHSLIKHYIGKKCYLFRFDA
ncbi:hypothetical protein AHAS_Ahas11G0118500 [Arachis hypogaea]